MKINDQIKIQLAVKALIENVIAKAVVRPEFDEDVNGDGQLACRIWARTQGAMFEVLAIAYFHGLHELGDGTKQILYVQENFTVPIYKRVGVEDVFFEEYGREPDVVIRGAGSNPIWIELKSAQAYSGFQHEKNKPSPTDVLKYRAWDSWSLSVSDKKEYRRTRQFILDRVASHGVVGDKLPLAGEMQWYFLEWLPPWTEQVTIRKKGVDKTVWVDRGVPPRASGYFDEIRDWLMDLGSGGPEDEHLFYTIGEALPVGDGKKSWGLANTLQKQKNSGWANSHVSSFPGASMISWPGLLDKIQLPPEVSEKGSSTRRVESGSESGHGSRVLGLVGSGSGYQRDHAAGLGPASTLEAG